MTKKPYCLILAFADADPKIFYFDTMEECRTANEIVSLVAWNSDFDGTHIQEVECKDE